MSTPYASVFVCATDAAGNAQRLTTTLAVVMADDAPPKFRAGYPAAVEVDAHAVTLLLVRYIRNAA